MFPTNNVFGGLNLTNFIIIGYTAWKGFLKSGHGAVICHINTVKSFQPFVSDLPRERYLPNEILNLYFVSQARLEAYLSELILAPEAMPPIFRALDNYNPQKDIILVIQCGSRFEVNVLQNTAITPPECYQQVCQRWEEFQPSFKF